MYITRSFRYFRITDIEVRLLLSQDIQDKLRTFHGHVGMSLQVAYDRHSEVGVVYAKISYVCINFFNKCICLNVDVFSAFIFKYKANMEYRIDYQTNHWRDRVKNQDNKYDMLRHDNFIWVKPVLY